MRKRLAWCVITVLAVIGLIIAIAALRPPPANLLTRAKKAADVQDGSYFSWVSDHELIVLTYLRKQPPLKPAPFNLEIVDTATGTRNLLAGLTAAIVRNRGELSVYRDSFTRSPNGQCLVWLDQKPGNNAAHLVAAHQDGSCYRVCTHMLAYPEGWLDDTHFVATTPNAAVSKLKGYQVPGLMLVDAATPSFEHPLTVLSSEGRALRMRNRERLGYPPPGSANVVGERGANSGEILIREYRSSNGIVNKRTIDTLQFPRNAKIRDVYTNARQARVLIQLLDPQVPAYAALVQRIFPNYRFTSKPIERLYVYKVPERRLQDLGSVPSGPGYTPLLPTWLNSTNTIDFYFDHAVYTVPADQDD